MPSLAFSAVGTMVGTMINFGATKKKGLSPFEAKSLVHMVGVKGFEPSTPCTPCYLLHFQQDSKKFKKLKIININQQVIGL